MRTIDEIINSLPLDRQEAIKAKSDLLLEEYNNRKYIVNILLTVEELSVEDYLDIIYCVIELIEINNLKQGLIDKLFQLDMQGGAETNL